MDVGGDVVVVVGADGREGGPRLAGGRDELAWVVADAAAWGWGGGGGVVLRTAGGTDREVGERGSHDGLVLFGL